MNKIKITLVLGCFATLVSCGPGKDAEENEKRKEDSLMEIQRNDAIKNAEELLKDTSFVSDDTLQKAKK